jgi:hypothetical protein
LPVMKDLVDHIRTVHFTLLAVSLILLAALQIPRKRPLEKAADDAEAIYLISQQSLAVSDAVKNQLNDILTRFPYPVRTTGEDKPTLAAEESYHFEYIKSGDRTVEGTFSIGYPYVGAFPPPVDSSDTTRWTYPTEYGVPGFTSLKQFMELWDEKADEKAREGRRAILPLYLSIGSKSVKPVSGIPRLPPCRAFRPLGASSHAKGEDQVFLRAHKNKEDWDVIPFVVSPIGVGICAFQKVTVYSINVDLPRALRSVNPQAFKWGNGSFSQEFSDLLRVSKYLEEAPLGNLASALRDRADEEPEKIELFQAKLPASIIPTYGILILILCQLYLLAHLFELKRLAGGAERQEWPTGYIGLYQSLSVFVFVIISLTVFPLMPSVQSFILNTGLLSDMNLITALVSLAIGIVCSIVLLSIRRLRTLPAPKSMPQGLSDH